jgi:hypothetical protein
MMKSLKKLLIKKLAEEKEQKKNRAKIWQKNPIKMKFENKNYPKQENCN